MIMKRFVYQPSEAKNEIPTAPTEFFDDNEPIYRLMVGELLLDSNLNSCERDEHLSLFLCIGRTFDQSSAPIELIARLIHDVTFKVYCKCRSLDSTWCYLSFILDIQVESWLRENGLTDIANGVYGRVENDGDRLL